MITVTLKQTSFDEIVRMLSDERNKANAASQTVRQMELMNILQEMYAGKSTKSQKVKLKDSVKVKDKGVKK